MEAFSMMSPAASLKSEANDDIFDLNRLTPISDSSRDSSPSNADSPCPSSPTGSKRGASEAVEENEEAEKKPPAKKRRSWGQVLPTPTTNLPPRKRAKTEAEKEQRRVERVLRNRLAAQTSRERKRKEMEALEASKMETDRENAELKAKLDQTIKELEEMKRKHESLLERMSNGGSFIQMPPTPPSNPYATFSFPNPDISQLSPTLSPSLSPQSIHNDMESVESSPKIAFNTDIGLTQHPAVMLCHSMDPQCLPSQFGTSIFVWIISTLLLSWTTLVSALILSPLSMIRSAVLSSTWNLLASMISVTLVPFLRNLSLDTHPRIATGQVMRTQHRSEKGVVVNKNDMFEDKYNRSVIVIRSEDSGRDQTKNGNLGQLEKGQKWHSLSLLSRGGGGSDRRTQVGWRTRIF